MKLELDGAALHDALRGAIYQRNGTMPILGCALLDADGERLRITTSDLQAIYIAELPATVPQSGRICVSMDLLKAAAREGRLQLSRNADSSIMQATPKSGSKLRLPVLPAEDFPLAEDVEWNPLPLDPIMLADALRAVAYAAPSNDARDWCNGVALRAEFAAATNGHRLAMYPLDYAGPALILPTAQLAAVAAMLGKDAALAVVINDRGAAAMLRIANGERTLIVRLLDAQYPDISPMFAGRDDSEQRAVFHREKLHDAVRAFLPFALREGLNGKKLNAASTLSAADGMAKLTAGENEENCNWALVDVSEPIEFSCALSYLADTLGAIDADKVRVIRVAAANSTPRLIVEPLTVGGDAVHSHLIAAMRL